MNLHDKCPFCGAGIVIMENGEKCVSENWVAFECITSIHAGQDIRRTQSRECETSERVRLTARVTELEAQIKVLQDRHSETTTGLQEAIEALKAVTPLVAEMEERMKRLESAARAVYLDSIASDHTWTELETRNMHALRDVLEAKP